MKYKIPDGWLKYSSIGDVVPGTRFIPFKTPLKEELCRRHFSTADDWFTPAMLREKIPKLKLVIDLTFTDRYYNSKEFSDHGIQHVKIKCPGGGQRLPPHSIIYRFNQAIADFLESNSNLNDDALIGVHCTHGLNRTGFFICRYMVEYCGLSPEQSVMAFESARGHKMERQVYVTEISKHFNDIRGLPKRKLNERERRNSHTASKKANLNIIANWRSPNRSQRKKESHCHNYSIELKSNARPHQNNYARSLQNYNQNLGIEQRNSNTANDLNFTRRLNSNLQLGQYNSNAPSSVSCSSLNGRNQKDQGDINSCNDINYGRRLKLNEHPDHNDSNADSSSSMNWRSPSQHLSLKSWSSQIVTSLEDDANLSRPMNLTEQQGHYNPYPSKFFSSGNWRNQPRHLNWKSWNGQIVNSRDYDANLSRPMNLTEQQGLYNPYPSHSSNSGNCSNQSQHLNWRSWNGQIVNSREDDANLSRPMILTEQQGHYNPYPSNSSNSGNWSNQAQDLNWRSWNGQIVNSREDDANLSRPMILTDQQGHYNPYPSNSSNSGNWSNQPQHLNWKKWGGQSEDVNISRRMNFIDQLGHYNPNPYNAPSLVKLEKSTESCEFKKP